MTSTAGRLGYTFPFEGVSLRDHPDLLARAEEAGYTDAWTGEVDGADGFTPLAVAAMSTRQTRIGSGIVSAYTRGPAVLAMTAASVAELAPGRFCLGLGSASGVIVEGWNSIPFERPLSRVRDVTTVLRAAFSGEKVSEELSTVQVAGFRLARPPEQPIPIFIAALRPRMLRLAGAVADGVVLNWLSPDDVPRVVREVRAGAKEAGREDRVEVVCRVFVCPGDAAAADRAARRHIAAYLTVPVYSKFHEWLGRGEALAAMSAAWAEGRRKDATQAIPAEVVRDLIITGDADACRAAIQRYRDGGVDTVVLSWLPTADSAEARSAQVLDSLWELSPGAVG
jgi:probable F420-dependent oxidoreductase